MRNLFALAGPLLRSLDAETAHDLTIKTLASGVNPFRTGPCDQRLGVAAFGLHFANPVGLAAGFDKNAEVPDAMLAMGFGFTEAGTVTPQPQAGNPKPRLFRLKADQAVINRMGFNNEGHEVMLRRLKARRGRGGIVGVNIGANKNAVDRIADYVAGVENFTEVADYLAVNISSPNTPGLRGLQSRGELEELTGRVLAARTRARSTTPVLVKIAPDLGDGELEDIAKVVTTAGVDGLIVSNTTLSRTGLSAVERNETGGMSGKPLFERSTIVLARMYQLTGGKMTIIGAGGIHDGESAWQKMLAGASLIQFYSALVYAGPQLVQDIHSYLLARMRDKGLKSLHEVVGSKAGVWAAKEIGP